MDKTTASVKGFNNVVAGIVFVLFLCPSVASAATTWKFDMQDAFGDIQAGYTEVRGSQNWFYHRPETPGYGWDDSTLSGSGPFNPGSHLMADLLKDRCNGSQAKTFSADVDNGTYYVTLYFYWPSYDIDNQIIKAEGSEIYRLDLDRDNIDITKRLVTVNDGTLDLEFSDADSTGKRWLISGIDIKPQSDETAFGPDSAQITHPLMDNDINGPMIGRWNFGVGYQAYAGEFHYSRIVGTELVSAVTIGTEVFNNVNCLKMLIIETFTSTLATISMAQDTNGNVWVLKIHDHLGEGDLLLGDAFKSMFMPANPAVGLPAGLIVPEDPEGPCTIAEIGINPLQTNLGTYSDCIKIDCRGESFEFYCLGAGEVRRSWASSPDDVVDFNEGYPSENIGDATGDGIVSLDDPIFSLQVLSGLR